MQKSIKRFIYKDYMLILSTSLILLFIIIISSIIGMSKDSIMELNNSLSNNFLRFELELKSQNDIKSEYIENLKRINDIIIKNDEGVIFGSNISSQGLYFNGEYTHNYNIIYGRFFEKQDFEDEYAENYIVIGKNILDKCQKDNNEYYYYRGESKYKVIGVIGNKEKVSRFDNILIYNINSILSNEEIIPKSQWIVDSNVITYEEIKERIEKTIDNRDCIFILPKENLPNPLNQAINENRFLLQFFTIIITCIMLTLVRVIGVWVNSFQTELAVHKLVGATTYNLIFRFIKRYILTSFISIMITYILFNIIKYINISESKYYILTFNNFILPLLTIVVLGIFIMAYVSIYISRASINKIIKKGNMV